MSKCLVYGCPNCSDENNSSVQFHHFPKDPVIAEQWLSSCCIWNSEVDLDSARICSIHFDKDGYTSQYEMDDYGHYQQILKEDALPTLDLPQQAIVYKVENVEDMITFPDHQYLATGVIIGSTSESMREQAEDHCVKYEEIQLVPVHNRTVAVMKNEIDEKYANINVYNNLDNVKVRNDKLKKELDKVERSITNLKQKLNKKKEESQRQCVVYNKLEKILSNLELKSLSITEQKSLLAKVFSESQIKILSGKKKIYWSHDDMVVGHTIRHMSNRRCYIYLNKKLNIPLPALSSIKRWQASKKNETVTEEKVDEDYKKE